MRILLNGYTGKMGQMVIEAVSRTDDTIVSFCAPDSAEEGNRHSLLSAAAEEADVIIDFSNHEGTRELTAYAVQRNLPLVVCTTGQSEEEKQMIQAAAEVIPVFFSANMSLGIAALTDLAKKAAALFPDADIEIVEKHHNRKLDVPSGTALALADAIREVRTDAVYSIGRHEYGKRTKNEIGIHSLRMGNETGTHEIYINTGSEVLTLSHSAESRAVFADGALKAAHYLVNQKPGLYTMKDMTEA